MKRNNRKNFFAHINQFKKDGSDGQEGGGSEGGTDGKTQIDVNSEEFKSAVKAAADAQVSGLKTKNDEILSKLDEAKKTLSKFEGIDPIKMKSMMEHLDNSEEARLIAEGKIDDVIQKRADKIQNQFNDQILELTTSAESLKGENQSLKSEIQKMIVGDELRRSAIKAGVLPEALDDVLLRGNGVFQIDENREVVSRDRDGNLVKLEDGKLLNVDRFVESLRKTNPYYWPSSQSSSARGNMGAGRTQADQIAHLNDIASGGKFDIEAYKKARGK